jgi:hypothetical protein
VNRSRFLFCCDDENHVLPWLSILPPDLLRVKGTLPVGNGYRPINDKKLRHTSEDE